MFYLVLESHDGRAPGADSEEKREPVSDIDIAVADSLKVLDLKWPIREADVFFVGSRGRFYGYAAQPRLASGGWPNPSATV